MQDGDREVNGDAPCPCGSGKTYSQCCATKRFQWWVDENGAFFRKVPLTEEAAAYFREAIDGFREVFGRDPAPGEPLFLQAFGSTEAEISRKTSIAMRQAGIPDELIYAYEKTGLLLTEENAELMPDSHVAEWDAAVLEYRKGLNQDLDRDRLSAEEVREELRKASHIIGSLLVRAQTIAPPIPTVEGLPEVFSLFSLAKAQKTIKAVELLLREDYPDQAMACARGIYESYLKIVHVASGAVDAESFYASTVGIHLGTHAYARTKSGKPNPRVCVELKTGRTFECGVSTAQMAAGSSIAEDAELHRMLYDFMSSFVHPDLRHVDSYLDDGKFTALATIQRPDVEITVLFATILLLDKVSAIVDIGSLGEDDVATFISGAHEVLARALVDPPEHAAAFAELIIRRTSQAVRVPPSGKI